MWRSFLFGHNSVTIKPHFSILVINAFRGWLSTLFPLGHQSSFLIIRRFFVDDQAKIALHTDRTDRQRKENYQKKSLADVDYQKSTSETSAPHPRLGEFSRLFACIDFGLVAYSVAMSGAALPNSIHSSQSSGNIHLHASPALSERA